ncbi:methylenetetrahydrofolate reductase [Gryllotalpicola sp.]|uniref:methylenetetrahydrofolate reductase n=1 Tax=Gryllotalpicola sp. TaxID=1932787 RepID=UPI00262B1436|nr:methylenetetrahydrofolate reductase [Gryllotalpicola sp.]
MSTSASFSFELYPPRNAAVAARMPQTVQRLAAAGPNFISVTYGAGGSSQSASLDVLKLLLETTSVPAMAHLTAVGSTYAEAARVVREFLDAGVRSFLAIRGDAPDGTAADAPRGDFATAAELVQLIHRVQAERAPYREVALPGSPAVALDADGREKVVIAVAAFPNGHPESRTIDRDIDALLAKQAAGANLAITQLFFHAEDYLSFAQKAKEAGVEFPILPGIMPVTSPARLKRMLELSGEDLPSELAIALEVEPTDEGRREVGIEYAASLASRLVAGGAPGIHLYTFNQAAPALDVLARAGLVDSATTEKEPA